MTAHTSAPQVTNRGQGWQELTRTGHWRDLVSWVRLLDTGGRLLEPAQVIDRDGNRITVRVRVRVPRRPAAQQPRVIAARRPAGAHAQVRVPWGWAAAVVGGVAAAGVLVWMVWSAAVAVGAAAAANYELVVGMVTVAAGVAVGVWLSRRR